LERDVRIDEIKLIAGKYGKVASLVKQVFASSAMLVVSACVFNHDRRYVDAIDLLKVKSQSLGKAANAASEIKRAFFRREGMQRFDVVKRRINLSQSGLEKLLCVPPGVPLFRMRKHGPERIALAEEIPVFLK